MFYNKIVASKQPDNSFRLDGFPSSISSAAFVAKFLTKAKDLIELDASFMTAAFSYLASKQNTNGSFTEQRNPVLKDELISTANVLISFYENDDYAKRHMATVDRASQFIEDKLNSTDDSYALAICGYALSFRDEHRSLQIYNKLIEKSKNKKGKISWDDSVETASCAILMAMKLEKKFESAAILKGLADQQRSLNGGFGSAQTSTLAFQASSEMATHFVSNDCDLKLGLSNDHDNKTVTIDNSNADRIQSIKLRGPDVSLQVEGKGIVFYQVIRRYRKEDGSDEMRAFTESCGEEDTKGGSGFILHVVIAALLALVLIAGVVFFVLRKRSIAYRAADHNTISM
jgi:hypothetical protein